MTYKLKSREEFNEYLKNVKIIPSEDEFLINKFNSSSLFELYELFVKIKDDFQISPAMQKKLKKHLQTSFPTEVSSCLSFPVNKISNDKIEFILSSALSQSQKIELPYTNDVTHIRKRQEEKQYER